MARFIVYDTRPYPIEAEDEDTAFNIFINLTSEQLAEIELDGGNIEVTTDER